MVPEHPARARVIIRTNPHSLHEYRVNDVLANQPEFARPSAAPWASRWPGRTHAGCGEKKKAALRGLGGTPASGRL